MLSETDPFFFPHVSGEDDTVKTSGEMGFSLSFTEAIPYISPEIIPGQRLVVIPVTGFRINKSEFTLAIISEELPAHFWFSLMVVIPQIVVAVPVMFTDETTLKGERVMPTR